MTLLSGRKTATVLSGTVTADEDGYLATSIPLQDGLEILVDGAPAEILTINEAFAGTSLSEGVHQIEIRFSPPGKAAASLSACQPRLDTQYFSRRGAAKLLQK